MRDKSKAVEDKVAQLMESYTASKTSWDKEKEMFLDCIKTEQQDLQAVKEAYDELHRKHTEVSSLAKTQAQHISELEMRNSSRSLGVSAQVFPLNEPISSSELPSFGSLQHLASSQTKNPDCLEDMVVAKLVATGATGGREALNYQKGMNEKKHGGKDDNNKKEEERNTEQQRDREEVQGDDVKERGSTGEKRRTLTAQTTDRADRREDSQGSSEDAEDTRSPETETRDRAEGQGTDGAEERVKTAVHTSETQILSQTTTDWTTEKSNARQVVDFTDSLSRKVTEMDAHSSHVNKGCGTGREGQLLHTLDSDDSQSVHHRPYPDSRVQNLRRDEVQTQNAEPLGQLPSQIHQVSEKTAEEAADVPTEPSEPLSHSRICTNAAPLAAQTETTTTQTAAGNPCVITCNMKPTDEMCDIHVNEESVVVRTWVEPQPLPKSQEISEQQNGQLRSVATGDGDSSEGQSNVDTQEDHNSETAPVEKSNYKDVCVDITMDTVDVESELESVNCQQHKNSVKTEEATERETDLKVSVHSTGPRSSCDLVSLLHQFVQGSEQNTSGSGGRLRHPPSAIPMFPKGKHSKVPLVITRVSDLLDSSSVSGNAASLTRHQQGEWKALGETCRETTAADTGSRASLSITSFPVSTSSSAVSELPWQATAGCSRAPTSAAGPVSESDWEPSCSQEREDQQSSIRAQISKIEQFLNTERLCLSKRRKTDN
ncbi:uncharacterized protein LOC121181922 [Toxotes jaculatrix]|uniref:uncharacterized protein LOC121181922 n=1 Tax=Toxotes jaculatrix TaxID=941984 RepID=UPI001B3ADEBC|nr:uncharacterized protein LOC121181922 [Toxotes jaculatrix]